MSWPALSCVVLSWSWSCSKVLVLVFVLVLVVVVVLSCTALVYWGDRPVLDGRWLRVAVSRVT